MTNTSIISRTLPSLINTRRDVLSPAYIAYIDEINKRAELCRSKNEDTNCVGTAFYLTGKQESDELVHPLFEQTLKPLKEVKNPILGCFVAWLFRGSNFTAVTHIGVVTNFNPLLITHRDTRKKGYLFKNEPFKKVNKRYMDSSACMQVAYYLPNALRAIQNEPS
jgi:hypothetical protein